MKLLIATKSTVIAEALTKALSDCEVHICGVCPDTLTALERIRPDILIADLFLLLDDGQSLLNECRHKPKHILALTDLATESVLRAAEDAGIHYVILLPCAISHIVDRIKILTDKAPFSDT